jgi:predicted transposase/invertase (TIGR01784 family)
LLRFKTYFDRHKIPTKMAENNTPPNNINNPHDKYFKGVMSLKSVVWALNKQFLPKSTLDKLDLDTLELDTASYITDDLAENFADVVWRCQMKKDGQQARITLLYEHKSYKHDYPHFQLLGYIQKAWETQIKQDKMPYLTIPIVLYHGQEKWENAPMDSYFGSLEAEFLRFLPCFDYVLINLQNYSTETIKAIDSIFLQKTLWAFKHYWDKNYLKLNIVELLLTGYNDKKNDQTRSFIRMLTVYLTSITGMSNNDIREAAIQSNNNLKSEAMSLIDELIEEGTVIGIEKGTVIGIEKTITETIIRSWKNGIEISMIANITGVDVAKVEKVIAEFQSKK